MAEKKKKEPTIDELIDMALQKQEEAEKDIGSAIDKLTDAINNCPPEKVLELANAFAGINSPKRSTDKKGILKKLLKMRGAKMIAILATIGSLTLAGLLKPHDKGPAQYGARDGATSQDRTMSVLQVLVEDPNAFKGIEINDSMESDCIMMNKKIQNTLNGALKKAGYLDKDGNLKPLKMVDVSKADALGVLKKGLRAPNVSTH